MSTASGRVVVKVSTLTVAFYGLLSLLEAATKWWSGSPMSPLLKHWEIPDSHAGLVVLNWESLGVVALLAAAYAVAVVAWVRGSYGGAEVAWSAAVFLAASAVVTLLIWPDLSFALRDRNRVLPNPIDISLGRLLLYFPGGVLGQRLVAAALQVFVTLGILWVMGRAGRGEAPALGAPRPPAS